MSILHIDSSARVEGSNTRVIGKYLVDSMGTNVNHRDLALNPLPQISAQDLIAVHGSGQSDRDSFKVQLDLSNALVDELKQADTLVIGAPMYNFGIPASLKQWVDAVCRAGVSFKYSSEGPVGLLGIKRAYIITGSGGTPVGGNMDYASGYLAQICRFIGVEEIFHIEASGSKGSPDQVIAWGKEQVDTLLEQQDSDIHLGAA